MNKIKLNDVFVTMNATDVETVKEFCTRSKMIFNADVEKYDFDKHTTNIRLCGFGKTYVCRTASVWYSPKKRCYTLRIEESTLKNLMKSETNKFLVEKCYKTVEERQNNKESEYKFMFSDLASTLKCFDDMQSNYRKLTKSVETVESVTA